MEKLVEIQLGNVYLLWFQSVILKKQSEIIVFYWTGSKYCDSLHLKDL